MKIIFLGPPGAGKGTQAVLLADKLGVPHIATGDMMRAAIASGSVLGQQVKSYIDRGDLVPDDVTVGVVRERLSESDCRNGFVLDGFPRTLFQAEQLIQIFDELKESGNSRIKVIDIAVPREELLDRISQRSSGGRSDDSREVADHRLSVYERQTKPLSDFFEALGVLSRVDGVGTVEEVHGRIAAVLGG